MDSILFNIWEDSIYIKKLFNDSRNFTQKNDRLVNTYFIE